MRPGPKKQFDRGEVLERAMHVFWSHGYASTGMTQLLDEIGIGRQSLYNTFGDKRSLYLEAVTLYYRKQLATARRILERPGSPLGNLGEFFQWKMQEAEQQGFCGCLFGNALAEGGPQDRELSVLLGGFLDTVEAVFAQLFARAKACGELPEETDVDDLARLVVTLGQGVALRSKVPGGREKVESILQAMSRLLALDRLN